MHRKCLIFPLLLLLVACNGWPVPLLVKTPLISPSALPGIISPTPQFHPTDTPAGSPTPTSTPTSTETATWTPTVTPILLELDLLGCNTSVDITHGLGEVTNAYPVIRNRTGQGLTDVCATLSATDEAEQHPNKTACASALPAGYQVTLKVTVDTGFKQDTSIQVDVATQQGLLTSMMRPSCRDLGFPGWLPGKVGLVEPIP